MPAGRSRDGDTLGVADAAQGPLTRGGEAALEGLLRLLTAHYACTVAAVNVREGESLRAQAAVGLEQAAAAAAGSSGGAALRADRSLWAGDARADPALRDDPFVRRHGLRFYASAPVTSSDGRCLGTVVVADRKPRSGPAAPEFLVEAAALAYHLFGYRKSEGELRRLTQIMQALVEGPGAGTGPGFLKWLTQHLVVHHGFDYAFVGEWTPDDQVELLAAYGPGGALPLTRQSASGVPCAEVLSRRLFVLPSSLAQRYPAHPFFRSAGLAAYGGVRLDGPGGDPVGLLALLSRRPFERPDFVATLLRLCAPRAGRELERMQAERRLRHLVEGTAGTVGEDFFRALTSHLARLLEVKAALVTTVGPDERSGEVLALTLAGRPAPPFRFDPRFTPCGRVLEEGVFHLEEGIAQAFPRARYLRQWGVSSFLGVAVPAVTGRPLGTVAVLDTKPLKRPREAEAYLRVFAARAGAELERQRMEQRRLEAERALADVQRLRSLRTLAGGVAHDFNNLLLSILGHVSLAARRTSRPQQVGSHLLEIERAARQAADLARQMLAYAGRATFAVEAVNLAALVREMEALLQAAGAARLELDVDTGGPVPLIQADPTQLRQVVMNLVLNAAEALGDREGRVRVRVETRTAAALARADRAHGAEGLRGEAVVLAVEDDGPGIDRSLLDRIFDPYFSTKGEGRGLGLATVLGIVRSHRGAVAVRTSPGRGTTVEVWLPAAQGRVEPRAGGGPDHPLVLVVDDEEHVRRAVAEMLGALDCRAALATSGAEAETLLAQERPAVVLLDLTMPPPGGAQVLRALRRRHPDLPILLMSGYAPTSARGLGAQGFLEKPFDVEALAAALAPWLRRPTAAP